MMSSCPGHMFLTMLYGALYRILPFTFHPQLRVKIKTQSDKGHRTQKDKRKQLHNHHFTIQRILAKEEKQLYVSKTFKTEKQFTHIALIRVKDSFIKLQVTQLCFSNNCVFFEVHFKPSTQFPLTLKFYIKNFTHDNMRGDPKNGLYLLKNCVLILTCLNFIHLQSPL